MDLSLLELVSTGEPASLPVDSGDFTAVPLSILGNSSLHSEAIVSRSGDALNSNF